MRAALAVLTALLVSAPGWDAGAETPVERGSYLVRGIVACGNCHTPHTAEGTVPGEELAGALNAEEAAFTAYAGNITPDSETGIGRWSDADLGRAIREGVRPDGSLIGPPMPIGLYRGISDEDLAAIVAYVRSVPAVRNSLPKSVYRIPLPPSYGPPVGKVAAVDRSNHVAYGAYLAGPLGHCIECHTPMTPTGRDFGKRTGAGGDSFAGPWGVSVAANITPHPTDGIATYSDAELKTVITTGRRPNGVPLQPPMGIAFYARMNDADLDAVIAYLRSLAPVPSP